MDKLADNRIALWIAELLGRPFAFIQDYDVHGWPQHHFAHLPKPARGMDLYIGEQVLIGIGNGAALVRQHVEGLFSLGVRSVGIDPHPDNVIARRTFQKAGFHETTGPVETRWNRAILMERHAPV